MSWKQVGEGVREVSWGALPQINVCITEGDQEVEASQPCKFTVPEH